ncbi:MAG TPA: dihydrofolate reductase family protein [Polyangiaceae bacterium]|nr:dihydrofolate reductase family protein [Polyangiaceae bacterium]
MSVELPTLEALFETSDLPAFELPEELLAAYGGPLGFERPRVVANFVTSLDGVVGLPGPGESGGVVSGGSAADRFVMGLLRACADTVLVGAGTFRRTPNVKWTADAIFPAASPFYAELRRSLGLPAEPRFVVVSASGDLDPRSPALSRALVATTSAGAERLRPGLSPDAELFVASGSSVPMTDLVPRLRGEGRGLVLAEGGPSLFAELVQGRLLDELFLTLSPALFGRFGGDGRKSLADGLDVRGARFDLLGLRREGSLLFTRYALEK